MRSGKRIKIVQGRNRSGLRWIPSKSSLGLDKRNERRNCGILGESEAEWQVASERPIVLMPTLIRWWEALRAPEVANWQQKYRMDWDATDGRNGGSQRTVWEMFMEVERFNGEAKEENQGAVALVLDLAKAFERVGLPVLTAWATHFSFPKKILRVLRGYFKHQRRVQFKGCAAEPANHVGFFARVQVELFAFSHCFAGCVGRSQKNLSFFEAECFGG